jgi:hypothetical protein
MGIGLLVPALGAQELLPSHRLDAARLAQYRNFVLKSDLPSILAITGADPSEVKTTHQRPALLQDLDWRPSRWKVGSTAESTDPVELIGFSLYNNQLFRMVVDYAGARTAGMTVADMVDAISVVYGTPVERLPGAARPASQVEIESGPPIARWGDTDHAVLLFRTTSYGDGYRLIVLDRALSDLARKAMAQGTLLDEQGAPRMEMARQKKEMDDARAATAQARLTNKKAFRL